MQERIVSIVAAAALSVGLVGTASAQITRVSGDIPAGTSETWCDNEAEIVMDTPVFVLGNLTIEEGCIVRGQPRTALFDDQNPTDGAPGVLVVSPGGFLDAQGTPTNPIIMTTAAPDVTDCSGGAPAVAGADGVADDADCDPANGRDAWTAGLAFLDDTPLANPLAPLAADGSGNIQLWGGFVVLGNAPTNLEDEGFGYGRAASEGLQVPGFPTGGATYGGTEPHDCSGIMRYISVRHAGDVIGEANELNGVTLGAVGDCTVFENIEVYTNQDDGIEYFGGTLNSKNLAISFVGDDSLDLDQGYDGNIQNVLSISTFFNLNNGNDYGNGGSGDAAGEWDGDDNTGNVNVGGSFDDADLIDRAFPLGAPAVYNMTAIGNTLPGANPAASPNGANRGIRMRNDFEGLLANSIIVNTGTEACYTYESADLADSPNQSNVYATSCSDAAAPDAGGIAAADRGDADASRPGGITVNYALGLASAVGNASSPLLAQEDQGFDPDCSGTGGKLVGCKATPVDPRPDGAAPAAEVGGGIIPTGTGLDSSATYRGAFPAGQPLWTDGWTALDAGGIL